VSTVFRNLSAVRCEELVIQCLVIILVECNLELLPNDVPSVHCAYHFCVWCTVSV